MLLSCLFLLARRRLTRLLTIAVAVATFAALPVFLASRLIEVDVFPALLLIAIVAYRGFSLARVEATRRTNPASDLPNLVALIESEAGDTPTVIALKLRNQAEILASFPNDVARALIGEVERRLRVAGGTDQLYHGEDGLFWTSRQPVSDELLQHLRGLHKLLAQPIQLGDRSVDLLTAFGIDGSTDRPLTSRIASATLSAEEAARANEIWKLYDPQRNHAAAWQLSLMGRLDFAIESGELWVAYQPKVSLPTRQIVGMEALVRWNHPTAGPLNPMQFIAAAEAHNKIAALTYFVLDRALAAGKADAIGFPRLGGRRPPEDKADAADDLVALADRFTWLCAQVMAEAERLTPVIRDTMANDLLAARRLADAAATIAQANGEENSGATDAS